MKFVIVSTALLALTTALPSLKLDSQNEMFQENENSRNKYYATDIQEQQEFNSISNSFDPIANIINQYKNDLTKNNELNNVKNEISIPDTVNVGVHSDTLLTNTRVKGLKNFNSQNLTMSWGEDLVNAENSWEKLTINGVYHYMNSVARYNGVFEIVLVEPKYSGNTSLTKNANIYPMMSPASSITFKKAVIYHTKLPEVFQNDKPQFDDFINNVVCQYIATAVATDMYNDVTMNIRQSARPYLKYQSGKIANDATSFSGQLENGNQFVMKNIHFDNVKNNLAKILLVQMNSTNNMNTAKLHLRLLDFTGESDWTVTTSEGRDYNGNVAFKFDRVQVIPTLNLNDKTVHTKVLIKNPQFDIQKSEGSDSSAWINAKEQLNKELVEYCIQKLGEMTSRNIKNIIL